MNEKQKEINKELKRAEKYFNKVLEDVNKDNYNVQDLVETMLTTLETIYKINKK